MGAISDWHLGYSRAVSFVSGYRDRPAFQREVKELCAVRVTFDSNAWQKIVVPNLARKTSLYDAFTRIHEALRTRKIQGFVCEM
jgi:hypothetical protein